MDLKLKWKNLLKKGMASLICVSMLFGAIPTTAFAENNENISHNYSMVIEQSSDKQEIIEYDLYNDGRSTRGWQSFLTKKFVKACAKGVRKGMKNKYVRRMVTKYWDDATALIFFEYADDIADKLDDLLVYDVIYNETLINNINELLLGLGVEHQHAYSIADGIAAVIRFFTV